MCDITSGRERQCKSQMGGVRYVYILEFIDYEPTQLVRTGLTLTSFPTTTAYKFEILPGSTFTENQREDNDGKYYEQQIEIKLVQNQYLFDLERMLYKDVRIVFEDYNGNTRMMGAYNGVFPSSINYQTGGGHNELNGMSIQFEAREDEPALFMASPTIPDITVPDFLQYQDDQYVLYQTGGLIQLHT